MTFESRGDPLSPAKNEQVPFADVQSGRISYLHGYQPENRSHKQPWSGLSAPPTEQRKPSINVLLTLERPATDLLEGGDRGERYRLLMAHAAEQRHRIEAWAEEQGLCDEIVRFGEPNSFQLLFVRCTPYAARQLVRAPGVVDVATAQAA